jgi:UDP-GlcNAc:undecaprenyl-phosphate/decaprenyl-phosphate GlcNAc-1-phosphate transferase
LPEGLQLVGSVVLSMAAALVLVPLAIRLATRTGFLDLPAGYKGHMRATPYLGGLAVVGAAAVPIFAFGAETSRYAALLIWAVVLFVVGTVDDKRSLNPLVRLVIEAIAGVALWHYGLGWAVFGSTALNVAITVLWVVGLVNAFNLMDNMDGASSSVAAVSALGAAALALGGGDVALAVILLAVAGACGGFLRHNLGEPSRIFLGDGGSMPLGLVVAGAVMAAPLDGSLGWTALLAAAPIVGLPILDTTLVVISRRRAGRAVLSGGRDHLTHRLRAVLGSPRLVAVALASAQAALCVIAIVIAQTGAAGVIVLASVYIFAGLGVIYTLESRFGVAVAHSAHGAYGVVPDGAPAHTASAPAELAA